jgi:hypothetical protein
MADADVFGKLSRIFEIHAYGEEEDLDDLLEDFEPNAAYGQGGPYSPANNYAAGSPMRPKKLTFRQQSRTKLNGSVRPTPYEVWEYAREQELEKTKQLRPIPKLNSDQWDRLVSKMHQSSRAKQRYYFMPASDPIT